MFQHILLSLTKVMNIKIDFLCAIILLTLTVKSSQCLEQEKKQSSDSFAARKPKLSFLQFLAPLAVADNCKSTSGLQGTCLSAQDCLKRGGRGIETCAWGLGVCCVYSFSCGGESTANNSYFISPNYPSAWTSNTGVCTFSVKPRLFAKVCQLRVDFEEFYITGPTSGVCSTDMFVASGQDLNNIVPAICGQNKGQHIYLQVGSSSGPFRFTITTSGESVERKWKIRITQIPCGSNAMAPPHCLQYYSGSVGSFESFNYGNVKLEENTYFENLDYTICLRKEAAMCGAVFTSEGDFNVNVAGTTGGGCSGDYLSFGTDKKCGNINAVQTGVRLANSGPMTLSFVSDDKTTVDALSRDSGFSLKYSQFSCSSRSSFKE